MSIYGINGSLLSSTFDLYAQELGQSYDISGNELMQPISDPSLTILHSEQIASGQSPQGMATYNGYIFQFFSTVNKMRIYRQSDYGFVNEFPCTVIGHGNNLQFGIVEQANGFPLLYASDSNSAESRHIYVASVDLSGISLLETISLPSAVGYYPNGVIDFANSKIYTIGYEKANTHDSSGKNVFCILDFDSPSTVIDALQFDYLGVMNGLLWNGNHIIMNANTWDGLDVRFHFIDPTTKTISKTLSFDKEYDSEYQGMSLQSSWVLVSKWIYKTVNNARTLFYEFYKLTS